jgi:hypothetical protein
MKKKTKILKSEIEELKSSCRQCGHITPLYVREVKSNRVLRIKEYCDYCGNKFI